MSDYWQPRLGEHVVYCTPDVQEKVGKVVGFVTEADRMPNRVGQPIIRWPADDGWSTDTPAGIFEPQPTKLGVTHPHFLWPAWFGRLVARVGFEEAARRAQAWGLP